MDDLFSRSVENIILMCWLVVNSRYSRVCNNWSWLTARKLLCKMCVHGSFKSFALLLTTTLLYENRFVVQNFALLQQFEPQSTKSSPFFLLRNCNTHNHKIQLNLAWAHFLIYILLSFLCENMSLFSCLVFWALSKKLSCNSKDCLHWNLASKIAAELRVIW